MKKFLSITIILLIAVDLSLINNTLATHSATVAWVKEPPIDPTYAPHPGQPNEYYWNGHTPKWINFAVTNNGPDPIKEIKIVFQKDADGNSQFNFSQTSQSKTGWYATPDEFGPNKHPTVLYFRTDSSTQYIQTGETARFGLFMTQGPDECKHNIDVWTVDAGQPAATRYYELFILIDKHPPKVELVFPPAGKTPQNGTDIQDGETVEIDAITTDKEGPHPSEIKNATVRIQYIPKPSKPKQPDFYALMKYDLVRKLYWWATKDSPPLKNEHWHNITVIVYDYSCNGPVESDSTMLFWYKPTPPVEIYNIDKCFLEGEHVGHVTSTAKLIVHTGFRPYTQVTAKFDTTDIGKNITDAWGQFELVFHVPEKPRGIYNVSVTDGKKTNSTDFTIIPWMWIDNEFIKEGFVGDQVSVTGKGFAASVDVNVIYRDVSFDMVYWDWALEWCGNATKFEWKPYLGNLTVGKARTNINGTFTLQFNIPESYGGFHPIFGQEVQSKVRSGWMPGTNPPPAPEPSYPESAFFIVRTKVSTEPDVGLSGQFVKLYASGLPLPVYSNKTYDCRTKKTTVDDHNWTLAIDFVPNKYWVFEKGFILNNEFDYAWASKLYLPFAYYFSVSDQASPVWNGTLSWRDAQGEYHKGSQFLKVPALAPGTYDISVYQFNIRTEQDDKQYMNKTPFKVLKDPLYVRVNTGTLYFKGENVKIYAEIDLDGTATDPTAISFQLYREEAFVQSLTANRVDTGLYTASFTPQEEGNYFIKVNATKTFSYFTLSGFGVSGFAVSPTLDGFNATLTALSGDVATIQTSVRQITTDISQINGKITNIEGNVATISTDIGKIKTDVSTINSKVVKIETIETTLNSMGTNVATIQTDIGTIKTTFDSINAQIVSIGANTVEIKTAVGDIQGKVTSIQGKTVEIQTSIGEISVATDAIKSQAGLQPTNLALSLIAALSAIFAAILILRKLYK